MGIKQTNASNVHEGDTIMLDGAPCRVMSVSKSKPGKHGAAKARIVGIGILDEKKRDLVMPGSDRIDVPLIEKKSAQVLSIVENKANVMDTETYETFDLVIPEELKGKVKDSMQVLYWEIMGSKMMKQIKGEQ
ncbi:MAG TPA: translation initiation factor IF-5A [Candidatus Nanoarchaeia archaeon]|nr:translation initiation factor IF-5A [Candidatus Nanoarchaeia archaeon]